MPTFTFDLDYGITKQLQSNVNVIKFGDGYEQRQEIGMNSLRQIWSVSFSKRTTAEADSIETFLVGLKGVSIFDWTPPGAGGPLKFKCDLNTFSRVPTSYGRWNLSAKFEQVHEP